MSALAFKHRAFVLVLLIGLVHPSVANEPTLDFVPWTGLLPACRVEWVTVYDANDVDLRCVGDVHPSSDRVRLTGLVAPGLNEPGGVEARDRLAEIIRAPELWAVFHETPNPPRYRDVVLVPGPIGHTTPANAVLVSEGLALANRKQSDRYFIGYCAREAAARQARIGLWVHGVAAPIATTGFRSPSQAECEREISIRSDPLYGLNCGVLTCSFGHLEGARTSIRRHELAPPFRVCRLTTKLCGLKWIFYE